MYLPELRKLKIYTTFKWQNEIIAELYLNKNSKFPINRAIGKQTALLKHTIIFKTSLMQDNECRKA